MSTLQDLVSEGEQVSWGGSGRQGVGVGPFVEVGREISVSVGCTVGVWAGEVSVEVGSTAGVKLGDTLVAVGARVVSDS